MSGMTAYSPEQRERLRETLVSAAKSDARITAAAHTGSLAVGKQDRWSDIDLALCIATNADIEPVVAQWTDAMYRDHGAVAHHDMRQGATLFRVFLLDNTLQVDIAFWPPADFAAVGRTFSQIFGPPARQVTMPPISPVPLIGMAWLYALHVRSSLARGRFWQTEYMLSGMRDQVLMLACVRQGLSPNHGRGLDDLAASEKAMLHDTLARSLEPAELKRAFATTTDALVREIGHHAPELGTRLPEVLSALVWQVRDEAVLERSGIGWISSPGSSSA